MTGIVWFIDRALGRIVVADALREAGCAVELHGDHFAADAPDVDWLPVVAARGWIVLTKDGAIARNELEREAVHRTGCRVFAFTNANVGGAVVAAALVQALPKMTRLIHGEQAPIIAVVHQDGRAEVRVRFPPLV